MQVINVKTVRTARIEQTQAEINTLIRLLTAAVANDPTDTDSQNLLTAYQSIQ